MRKALVDDVAAAGAAPDRRFSSLSARSGTSPNAATRTTNDASIDLVALAKWAADDAAVLGAHMIVPLIDKLDGFATAAANRGWDIHRIADRGPQAYDDEMLRLVSRLPNAPLVLITGDDRLAHRVQAQRTHVRIVSDLSGAPHKGGAVAN